jgi:hypothetical protein
VGWELVYNDELTALQWALNSAVECHLHTSSRFNIFNNLTGLPGTAKYLIIRSSRMPQRVLVRVLQSAESRGWPFSRSRMPALSKLTYKKQITPQGLLARMHRFQESLDSK